MGALAGRSRTNATGTVAAPRAIGTVTWAAPGYHRCSGAGAVDVAPAVEMSHLRHDRLSP